MAFWMPQFLLRVSYVRLLAACSSTAFAKRVRRPTLRERLPRQLRLGLWREAADRGVAVEVGGEGAAFRRGGDQVGAAAEAHFARGAQGRVERFGHGGAIDRFHRAAIGGGDLQQVADAPDVGGSVV